MTITTEATSMALSVTGLCKRYDDDFTLHDVTFDLPMGYIMGLIGPNGAGKSTVIKLILNAIEPDSGTIAILGADKQARERMIKTELGVVFDVSYFLEEWRVRHVERLMAPMYPRWDHRRYEAYLRQFGLDGCMAQRIKSLSRGMQMKLMLAVALSHEARLLILDEPTSGLDVRSRDELIDSLRDYLQQREASVLLSTHITDDLEHAADFLTYILDGTVYYSGAKDELEDMFRVVKGGPEQWDMVSAFAEGARRHAVGFEALVRTDRLRQMQVGAMVVEPARIDDIMRMTDKERG